MESDDDFESTYYVWSGSLKGTKVKALTPRVAIDKAVRQSLPCVLTQNIRVSLRPKGHHGLDVYFHAPYEDLFPELFNGDLDVEVARVESE